VKTTKRFSRRIAREVYKKKREWERENGDPLAEREKTNLEGISGGFGQIRGGTSKGLLQSQGEKTAPALHCHGKKNGDPSKTSSLYGRRWGSRQQQTKKRQRIPKQRGLL